MTDSDIAQEYKGPIPLHWSTPYCGKVRTKKRWPAPTGRCPSKVLNYLIAEKRKQPKLDPQGMIIGGADQAWYYRQDMRDVFEATPGMLAWLKRTKQRLPR